MQHSQATDDLFIISNDFQVKENEDIKLVKFFDCAKNSKYTLILRPDKVYVCLKLNHFGSVFSGNYVYEQANTLIVKEIDPNLLFVNIIYLTSKLEEDKFSCLSLNDVIYKYVELLNGKNLEEEIFNSSKEFLNFMNDFYTKNTSELEKISEKTFNSFMNTDYYKLSVSKILSYLNKKVSSVKDDSLSKSPNEDKNSASILTSFLPEEISESFLRFKNIVLEEETKNNFFNEEEINQQKRKNPPSEDSGVKADKKQKTKQVVNKPKTVLEDKSQRTMMNFLIKK